MVTRTSTRILQQNTRLLMITICARFWRLQRENKRIFSTLQGATRISRYDFSKLIAKRFGLNANLIIPSLSDEFLWIARRSGELLI
jgi:dTDP-4-dehydrorhamnose reductase